MNILFLTLADINTINERGIYQDLLREFTRNNHSVYIVSPSERKHKLKSGIIDDPQCKILKVKTGNIQKTNIVEKGISTVLLEKQYKNAIKKYFPNVKFDLVIYSTPPITLVKVIKYIKKRDNAKTYLLLKDIFPQNAVDIGMMKKSGILYKYFRKKEKKLYELSDYIGCMSQANVDYILKHNTVIDKNTVHVSPNSIEPVDITVNEALKNETRKKHGIPINAKVFIYGGNLGKPQNIPFVVECLKQNQNKKDRFFIVCGKGTDYQKLENYIIQSAPENIKLINGLSKSEYDDLVKCCDIGLIFLDKRFTIPNFPSRLLAYMENSMPVIACTDKNTDIGEIITNGNFGWWCESDNADNFTRIVESIKNDDIKPKGETARFFLENNYTVQKSYEIIINKVNN